MGFGLKSRWLAHILVALFIPGLIIAVSRNCRRFIAEHKDSFVETVVDFEELKKIAREEGWNLSEALSEIAAKGASSIGISEDTLASLEAEGRISILNLQEIQKLSMDGTIGQQFTEVKKSAEALWIYSRDASLLERIHRNLAIRLSPEKVEQVHKNILLVGKTSQDFRERVGLGFSTEFIRLAREKGLGVVLRVFNTPDLSSEGIRKIIEGLPPPQTVSAIIYAEEEVLGNRGKIEATVECFREKPYRQGLIEFNDQEGMEKLIESLSPNVSFVKVHSIGRKEMDENYNLKRAIARYLRAVRDRRMKMLYIRCFFQDKKKYIGDLMKFNLAYLSAIAKGLKKLGFEIARNDQQRFDDPRYEISVLAGWERFFLGFSLMMGVPFLVMVSRYTPMDARFFYLSGIFTVVIFAILPSHLFTAIVSLAGAIAFSTMGIIWGIQNLEERLGDEENEFSTMASGGWLLVYMVLPTLLGSLLVSGIHSEPVYLLKFLQFRGIKVAFIVPLLWVGLWALRRYGGRLLAYFSMPLSFRDLFVGSIVVVGVTVYLLRSGNLTVFKPSELEDSIRTFLENLLIARPRNKEFLIGYPAVFLFLFFRLRKGFSILPVLAIFMEMSQVSILNTFCHFHSPLSMALIRSFNGLWTGVLLGLLLLALYSGCRVLVAAGQKKNVGFLLGYFGFENLGDEMLWRIFFEEARKKRPDVAWFLLCRNPEKIRALPGLLPISRRSFLEVLEVVASVRYLVIPGGGVLQASTSYRSLFYYLIFLFFGKLFGARLLLPAQGMGPWERKRSTKTVFSKFSADMLRLATRMILDLVDHFSVRDKISLAALQELPEPSIRPQVSGDLVFLKNFKMSPLNEENPPIIVGVILRSSVPESAEIAVKLKDWRATKDSVRLIPMYFQPGEDDLPWENISDSITKFDAESIIENASCFPHLDLILSMRFHGCVIASMLGIPWIGLACDPKIFGLAEEMGWEFVCLPQNFGVSFLETAIQKISKNKESLTAKLRKFAHEKAVLVQEDVARCLDYIS